MDSTKTKITMEIPPDIRAILAEKSVTCGMDESSYAARVIIDYLKQLKTDVKSDGDEIRDDAIRSQAGTD